ncbi:MAG: hypothetical protein LQ340_006166 [Diploschistes diacapsis]|nr:MAG: hypothetical protein LQ340_006166 [Diploschistes diacapsis]
MVSRKPVSTQAVGNNQLPYPMTPSSSRNQPNSFDGDERAEENPWRIDHALNRGLSPSPKHTNVIPSMLDMNEDWVDAGAESKSSDGKDTLPAPLRINKQTSRESVAKVPDIAQSIKYESHELTPKSSWESDGSFGDVGVHPKNPASSPPTLQVPNLHRQLQFQKQRPQPPTNPFYHASGAERGPPTQTGQKDENSSDIWAELAENPTPSTYKLSSLDQQFGKLRVEEGPGSSIPSASEAQGFMSIHRDSPLISFDQGKDYRKELEHSPFASADDQDPWQAEAREVVPFEPSTNGKGNGVAMPLKEEATPFQDSETSVLPRQAPMPPILERKICVSPEVANRQRSETYQIKHIRWLDHASGEVRKSPILVQRKNGPCPLMALVNALTLSTPLNRNTALVDTLRVREQVSLGLLLDAVFDELMSERREDAPQELPDVEELNAFLIQLHTGMNVNPRFIPAKRREHSVIDGQEEEIPLSIRDRRKPGTFERTKDIFLYGTFSIPLVHGWIPPPSHPVFEALERSAQNYEDAQNLLFQEEELEDKLQRNGLGQDEQVVLEDIASIKYFLDSSATQLTAYGLDTIREALAPGDIVILFRNNHFGTLYKHPETGELMHLVTDEGYASHEEIVWESLIDINGEGAEFFSGDFRPVGNNTDGGSSQQQPFETEGQGNLGWMTVNRTRQAKAPSSQAPSHPSQNQFLPPPAKDEAEYNLPPASNPEQEDADYAMALQLEEDQARESHQAAVSRQREQELTRAYLQSQNLPTTHLNNPSALSSPTSPRPGRNSPAPTQIVRPLLPPRRDNVTRSNPRPPVHRETNEGDDDAPPSYEDASKSEPYNPSTGRPGRMLYGNSPAQQRSPSGQNQSYSRQRGQSPYTASSAITPQQINIGQRRRSGAPRPSSMQDPSVQGISRRRSAGLTGSGEERRDKDCVVM